jgi:hypothetical protein
LDRELRKLIPQGTCSFCGRPFELGSSTMGGFDARDNVVLACEGCVNQVAEIFAVGLELTGEHFAAAHAADAARYSGISGYILPDFAERFDRLWFEQNPKRAHRVRLAFPGEIAVEDAARHALIIVRQVKPAFRVKAVFGFHDAAPPRICCRPLPWKSSAPPTAAGTTAGTTILASGSAERLSLDPLPLYVF